MNLNDRAVVTELDPKGILALTEGFPAQCREAFEIASRVDAPKLENRPGVVALAGMGGSGAGGDFVRAIFEAHGGAPFIVVRDYAVPSYIGVGDVVFCASYSGNTEETLSAYASAKKSGARIVAVTSGGKLKEQAEADGYTVYLVPGGQPPRTALGYMMVPVLVACHRMKLIPDPEIEKAIALLETCGEDWGPEAKDNDAKALAGKMHGALPIIYGLGSWQGYIANRWRCQINENAKHLAFVNTYPELNHNEIMGWVGATGQSVGRYVGVVLEDGSESVRMKARARVTEGLIGETCSFTHVPALGETLLEKMLTLAHYGDYVSVYLARLNGVDPEDIGSINRLKDELAKVS
ncbi:bifunctional phosphoglucose/phosphomannose isomerase [Fimbriimonas ginsengisoli]|uniref:Bifunctional phosphoglucose/phosphomannose isomerase n=1 Tax=Fimbriimonas ginsengisoli Gsoil 348 TaxID=661478 RepID=A0A068NS28_FIMGI|nr:bifunctional phosphoglucose/phosphomannose isomerase [Fimbriimonas ginsengisoli]AIE85540.1 bifunctional phosphoglucose/phosphomannose isomerase [Fimbriimonas ginsengisoli Gsoil 348]